MRIVDLSRELYHRTPSYPGQPPIIHGVWKTHEEAFAESGNVQGNSVMFFSMPDHGGTHIDAPRHFGKNGTPINEYPLENLHRAGHLHRPAAHRAEGRDHAGGPRGGGEEGRRAGPEEGHRAALHRPSRAHLPDRQIFHRQSGRERRGDRMAGAAGRRAFRHRLDAARARRARSTRWCTRPASSSTSRTSKACAISRRCSARANSSSSACRSSGAAAPARRSAPSRCFRIDHLLRECGPLLPRVRSALSPACGGEVERG